MVPKVGTFFVFSIFWPFLPKKVYKPSVSLKSFLKDLSNGILGFEVVRFCVVVIVKSVFIFGYFIWGRILVPRPNSHILFSIKFKTTRVFWFCDIRFGSEIIAFFPKYFFSKIPKNLYTFYNNCHTQSNNSKNQYTNG